DQFAIAFGNVAGAIDLSTCTQQADVSLLFDHFAVSMLAGRKPVVDVGFKDVRFGGYLKFVQTIRSLIPLDGFSDPPFVDVTASGVSAGFTQALPNLAIGMFSLENMRLVAVVNVPFLATGSSPLNFSFDFCTPDHPFLVTVAFLGGGGYF